jgi:hypothetical protein
MLGLSEWEINDRNSDQLLSIPELPMTYFVGITPHLELCISARIVGLRAQAMHGASSSIAPAEPQTKISLSFIKFCDSSFHTLLSFHLHQNVCFVHHFCYHF